MPALNRRMFLQTAAAAGLAPALPAFPAAAAPAVGHTPIQYAWASYYAQMNNACSPAQIMSALKVSPAVADSLFSKLISRNIISAPGIGGVSTAMKPFYKGVRFPGAVAAVPANSANALSLDAKKIVARVTECAKAPAEETTVQDEAGDPDRT